MKLNIPEAKLIAAGNCHDCNAPAETWSIPGDMVVLHQGAGCKGFRTRFTPTEEKPTCSRGMDEKGFDSFQGNTLDTKNPLGNQLATTASKGLDMAVQAGVPVPGSQAAIPIPPDEAPASIEAPASEKQEHDAAKCPLCGGNLPEEMKA